MERLLLLIAIAPFLAFCGSQEISEEKSEKNSPAPGKYFLKSEDSSLCIVINKAVGVQPCSWILQGNSSVPSKSRAEEVTISSSSSLSIPSYLIAAAVNSKLCIAESATTTTMRSGKCNSKTANFFLKSKNSSSGFSFSIETVHNECVGFLNQGPKLIRVPCGGDPNKFHQGWTLCSPSGRCGISPADAAVSVDDEEQGLEPVLETLEVPESNNSGIVEVSSGGDSSFLGENYKYVITATFLGYSYLLIIFK